jgi:hypothetical protein
MWAQDNQRLSTAMQPLEYETPRLAARRNLGAVLLFVLPGFATCLALYFVLYDATEEPFMVFRPRDAAAHVAIPLVSLGLWLYWGVLARREKLSLFVVVPLAIFALLKLWFVFLVGMGYLSEGWNT